MIERDVLSVCHALLALQNQCFKFQEGSSNLARREEALQNYNEICLDAKAKATVSSKYAKLMISNAGFQEAIQATKASLAHPLMDLILSSFRTHGALASDLAHEISGAANILKSILCHLINLAATFTKEEIGRAEDVPEVNLAKEMVHILSKIVLALDGSRNAGVFRAALKSYPAIESSSQQLQEVFGLEVEEVRKMAQVLQREGDALRKRYNQKVAATKIQAWWRGIIQKRKWLSIRRGFISLQDLYRKRLLNKERFMRERLQKSELTFQGMYEEIVQNRIKAEKRFKELLEAKQNSHSYSRPIPDSRQDFQTQPEDNFQWTTRQEMAAVVIQIGVRKWLRRLRKRPIWLQSLMIPSTLNEEKIRRYQDEIELWQQNHQVPPMDPTELQELHQRAQLEFMAFNKRALESKRVEHMALSKMAQTKTILSILETAPTLEQYHPDNRTDFMSLPLPIAVKSRLEHKAAMARLNMPRWQRILQDIEN